MLKIIFRNFKNITNFDSIIRQIDKIVYIAFLIDCSANNGITKKKCAIELQLMFFKNRKENLQNQSLFPINKQMQGITQEKE